MHYSGLIRWLFPWEIILRKKLSIARDILFNKPYNWEDAPPRTSGIISLTVKLQNTEIVVVLIIKFVIMTNAINWRHYTLDCHWSWFNCGHAKLFCYFPGQLLAQLSLEQDVMLTTISLIKEQTRFIACRESQLIAKFLFFVLRSAP